MNKIRQKLSNLFSKNLKCKQKNRISESWNHRISDVLKPVYTPKTPFCGGYTYYVLLSHLHCLTYQQLPSSPCEMSSGIGVLYTTHGIFMSVLFVTAILSHRNHCTSCLARLQLGSVNNDLWTGGKESSTNFS